MGFQSYIAYLATIFTVGFFLIIDLMVTTTIAHNTPLLHQHLFIE
jgi:hypothetical protein